MEDNIKNTYLNPTSSIYEEPQNLLKQEVREPAIYNAIIAAIATGYTKMSEISTKVGEDTSVCATYIKNLVSLGIVKRETPFGEDSARKTIYSLEDNMFRFGIALCRKIHPLSPAAQQSLLTVEYNHIYPITWAAFLKKSASNIFGHFY